jgi:folate-binding protein YgfZ
LNLTDQAAAAADQPADSSKQLLHIPALEFGANAELELHPTDAYPMNSADAADGPTLCWQQLRTAHFWPLMGVDIWEKCIPQELDRTEQAISFTKGCYLGQETIARLDARGQIQKKLSLLRIDGPVQPQQKLLFNDQEVGQITSAVASNHGFLALAVLRRGFFELDTRLTCCGFAAQVIDSATAIRLIAPTQS